MNENAAGPREPLSSRRLWLALSGYAALLIALAIRHEMWRDEVRAFSVATRAATWGQMLSDLHHEGHPALWYVVLRAGYAITHSNLVLPVAALIISIATAYLILRYAPFPFWLRLLAVFGAFMGFELSVMARNYGIGVLFMIAACVVFPRRGEKPWFPAICLAFMANTSVHAALAALVILFVWIVADLVDDDRRPALLRPAAILSIVFVFAAIGLAFATAAPSPDMAWAANAREFNADHIIRTIFSDPGVSLRGVLESNVAAAGEFPWRYLRIDPGVASRIIVDIVLLWLLRALGWRFVHAAAMVITIVGLAALREVYSGALRHEAVIAFLLFSIAWLAVDGHPDKALRRRITLGLLPLFAVQSAALPFVAQRYFFKPASVSKLYGKFLATHPQYRAAILMSEPDYLMEAMPYYAPNRVYMPRQGEFHYRVYFDQGTKRIQSLNLTQLVDIANKVACENAAPVLLALGNTDIPWRRQAVKRVQYGARFSWTAEDRKLLRKRTTPVASFPESISDEYYHVFEVHPSCKAN